MKGKIKWIILAIIAILIVIVAVYVSINEAQLQYDIEEIKEYNYFALTQKSKYGVVDKNGNVIIEPNYTAIQIPNPSKPVFICISDYNEETQSYDTLVFNDKKERLFENYDSVQAIAINTNVEANPYEKSVLSYKKDGKYGLITLEGKEVTKAIYDDITSINSKEGTFLVKNGDYVGVINMKGKVIIKSNYETITSDNYYNEETKNKTAGFIVSKKTDEGFRYGYINYKGQVILDTEYTELERVTQIQNDNKPYFIAFKDGQAGLLRDKKIILNYEYQDIQYHSVNDVFIITRNGMQGAVNKDGTTILNPEYDSILFGGIYLNAVKGDETFIYDTNGNKIETENISLTKTENPNYYIAVDKNEIYTVVDANNNVLIDDNYTYIEYLTDDYFIVAKGSNNGIIDSKGNVVVDLKYTSIFKFNDTNLVQAEITNTKTIELYNIKMQKVASMNNATIKQYEPSSINENKYIMLASATGFEYYDVDGNKLQSQDIFKSNTLFAKKGDNNKWGFVDIEGNVKVEYQYDMVTDFNENGFAGIKLDGKWGVVNQNGEIICEPIYKINWIQPTFLGKYYRVNIWYDNARFSDDES